MYTRTIVRNGTTLPIPTFVQRPQTTAFLQRVAKTLSENKTSMDTLAKTPVTKQDLLGDVTVMPL